MSTKYIVAAAAIATIATTTEASRPLQKLQNHTMTLLDEEQADWNFNAGIQGGAGGKPQWQVGIGAKWDEDEEQTCFGTAEVCAKMGQKPNPLIPRTPCWGITCGPDPRRPLEPRLPVIRPCWGIHCGDKPSIFDDEEAKLAKGSAAAPSFAWQPSIVTRPAIPTTIPWDESQKLRLKKVVNGIKKVNNVVNKAQQVGLLDEEQADWNFNAGISGGAGGKPQWQVGIGATWDEEQKNLFDKLDKALDTIDRAVTVTNNVKSLFDEEQTEDKKGQVEKALKAMKKVNDVALQAMEKGLINKEGKRQLRSKFAKIMDKLDLPKQNRLRNPNRRD